MVRLALQSEFRDRKNGRPVEDELAKARRGSRYAKKPANKASLGFIHLARTVEPLKMRPATLKRYCKTLIPGYDPWKDSKGYRFDADKAMSAVRFFHEDLTTSRADGLVVSSSSD